MKRFKELKARFWLTTILCILTTAGARVKADFVLGTPAKVPNINTPSNDSAPSISADGLELYFQSNGPDGGDDFCKSDIWVSSRSSTKEPWSAPVRVELSGNYSGPTASPCISADGLELYFSDGFTAFYEGTGCEPNPQGFGGGDLWVSKRTARQAPWGEPENLGPTVNSANSDDAASISADGLTLYFVSDRPGRGGDTDIYVTTRPSKNDPWGPTMKLDSSINGSMMWESGPQISPDGLSLFFSKQAALAQSDIYVSHRADTLSPWRPSAKLASINSSHMSEYDPTFSPNDSHLYFSRGMNITPLPAHPNLSTYDIWQTEVIPIVDFNGDGRVDGKDLLVMTEHWEQRYSPCDISPMPSGDGVVDLQDLRVLAHSMGQAVNDPNLLAHWALDEAEGEIAYDSAFISDGAVIGNPVWKPEGGQVDGALVFDGIDDFILNSSILNPAEGNFSIFAWVKGGAPDQVILSHQNGHNWLMADTEQGMLRTDLTQPSETIRGGRTKLGPSLISSVTITDGNWHRVGLVRERDIRVLYVDDVEVARDIIVDLASSHGGLIIGGDSGLTPGSLWSGMIDDVRIYDRVVRP